MITTKRDPFARNHLIRNAISAAIYDCMKTDPSIYLFGEGAHMKMHYDAPHIEKEFPDRVVTLPISEDGNTNFAVGASLLGVKPVVDVITADFLYRTMDSICNTAAKRDFVAPEGSDPPTIVVRSEFLLGGPTTGQRPEALFTHIPGLNVVCPSTPRDAYGLMLTALTQPGTTLFFEDRMIEDDKIALTDCLRMGGPIPLASASVRRRPSPLSLSVITYGLMRQVVESALDQAKLDNVNVVDLRTLYPLDWPTLFDFAHQSRRILIVEPDIEYGGIGAEISAKLYEANRPPLRVRRLGAPHLTIPASIAHHQDMLPTEDSIIKAIHSLRREPTWKS